MFSNTFQRFSKVMLVASIVLTFVAVAHADGGKKKSRAKTTMTLEDALHLRIDVIEVASKTLAPTTDQQLGNRQIVDAVRGAVEAGTGRVRYTFETPMVVNRKLYLTADLNEPFVKGRQTNKKGQTNPRVSYEDVGCTIDMETKRIGSVPEDGVYMNCRVKLKDLKTTSGVRVDKDLDAPLYVSTHVTFSAIVVPGDTIAFRAGVQRGQVDDARVSVVIVTIMATQPKSPDKPPNK